MDTSCSRHPSSDEAGNVRPVIAPATASTSWRQSVPVLACEGLTLREVTHDDACSLLEMLGTDDVSRFMSPLPATLDSFARFVAWTHRERAAGGYVCFAVLPPGIPTAVGLFQVRSLEPGLSTAEWGFALGSPFWGTGLFAAAARLVADFAFSTVGVRRLEARACVENTRGNRALRKLGATPEGVLRRSFLWHGEYHDQVLWSILDSDWARSAPGRAR